MGRTASTEPQCLYKGGLYLYLFYRFQSVPRNLRINHLLFVDYRHRLITVCVQIIM